MFLRGRDGSELEVAILDWGDTTKMYSADGPPDWVDVRVRVSTPTVGWTFGGECLDHEEVGRLADWLEAVGTGARAEREIEFTEPDLSFRLVDSGEDRVLLRVHFELRRRPVPTLKDAVFQIDMEISRTDLTGAASTLREEVSRLPSLRFSAPERK